MVHHIARPQLQLHKVGDKQKVFKLLDEYSNLVEHFDGCLIGDGAGARYLYAMLLP